MNQESIIVYNGPFDKFYQELQWQIITQYPEYFMAGVALFGLTVLGYLSFITWRDR